MTLAERQKIAQLVLQAAFVLAKRIWILRARSKAIEAGVRPRKASEVRCKLGVLHKELTAHEANLENFAAWLGDLVTGTDCEDSDAIEDLISEARKVLSYYGGAQQQP